MTTKLIEQTLQWPYIKKYRLDRISSAKSLKKKKINPEEGTVVFQNCPIVLSTFSSQVMGHAKKKKACATEGTVNRNHP